MTNTLYQFANAPGSFNPELPGVPNTSLELETRKQVDVIGGCNATAIHEASAHPVISASRDGALSGGSGYTFAGQLFSDRGIYP